MLAEKTLLVGLGSTRFRSAPFSSHEVTIDAEQLRWFEETIKLHPASDGWQVFVFSHAPILGSVLRVLQVGGYKNYFIGRIGHFIIISYIGDPRAEWLLLAEPLGWRQRAPKSPGKLLAWTLGSRKFIQIVRENACIKGSCSLIISRSRPFSGGWFSGHFHLSHDYEDSITFPGGRDMGL